jgi:hypothetical protein
MLFILRIFAFHTLAHNGLGYEVVPDCVAAFVSPVTNHDAG